MKKILKRILISVLALFLIISLASCSNTGGNSSGNSSGISVAMIQNIISKLSDDEVEIVKNETSDGYDFSYVDNKVANVVYSGKADKNGNVISVSIVNNDVDTSILKNKATLLLSLSKTAEKMTRNDIKVGYCIIEFNELSSLFGEIYGTEAWPQKTADVADKVYNLWNGGTLNFDKWTVSSEVDDQNKTVTINAVYSR